MLWSVPNGGWETDLRWPTYLVTGSYLGRWLDRKFQTMLDSQQEIADMKKSCHFQRFANIWEWELAGKQLRETLGRLPYCCAQCEASCICTKHKYWIWSAWFLDSHFAWQWSAWVTGGRPLTETAGGPEVRHTDPKQIHFVAMRHCRHQPDTVPPSPWDRGWVRSTASVAPCSSFWLRAPFMPSLELLHLLSLYLIGNIPLC